MTDILERVRQQYEEFCYPDVDPEDDAAGVPVTSDLNTVTLLVWGARSGFPEHMRVLDAGCGTGMPIVSTGMICPQAELTAIDISATSLDKAKRRAERCGVTIDFHQLPIEEVGSLGKQFDFIVSSGVLHHLADPAVGLRALADVLDPQGAMSIMLYGKVGREGVYMLQEAFALAFGPETPMADRVRFAHETGKKVPPWHPFTNLLTTREMALGKDAEVVDLLLHVRDVPFTVDDVYDFCDAGGMQLLRWLCPVAYAPETYTRDPRVRALSRSAARRDREAIAEVLNGRIVKHGFLAVKPTFVHPGTHDLSEGRWRALRARLTTLMHWGGSKPHPTEADTEVIPTGLPGERYIWPDLMLHAWERPFVFHMQSGKTLGEIADMSDVRSQMPAGSRAERDRLVAEFLDRAVSYSAIALLE